MPISKKDRFTQSDRKEQIYSDFLVDLNPHPASGDIVRFVNETAVIRSVKNLILTNPGERLYQPKIGSDINKLLFEPMDANIAQTIASVVSTTIENYEPRAKVISVDVVPKYDENYYSVSVVFMVVNKQEPVTVNVSLTRVR